MGIPAGLVAEFFPELIFGFELDAGVVRLVKKVDDLLLTGDFQQVPADDVPHGLVGFLAADQLDQHTDHQGAVDLDIDAFFALAE